MTDPFVETAQRWHDFFLLTGGAAATLTGLMFVAVTFGAGLAKHDGANATTMRAFVDPPLSHFVHVILTACVAVMPAMTGPVFGGLLFAGVGLRAAGLQWVYRHYAAAQRKHGDIELSDWLMGIVFPGAAFAASLVAAYELFVGSAIGLPLLAAATLAILVIGVRSAWELMLWLITVVAKRGD